MKRKTAKILSVLLCLLLIAEQTGFAAGGGTPADPIRRGVQVVAQLDISSHLARMHSAFTPDKFRPLHLRYLEFNPQQDGFRLLVDKGDFLSVSLRGAPSEARDDEAILQQETKQLLNYFFIGVALPNSSFWVNLRPDSPDNIIDDYLAQTDVGKILLEADLQLKKDTAAYTSPQTPEGREYWDKLYKKAGELLGSENITIPTLTRPWIVPGEIIVREAQDNAYIYKATLKVMLEEDYLLKSEIRNPKSETNSPAEPSEAGSRLDLSGQREKSQIQIYKQYEFKDPRLKELNEYSSQLIRELIIPKITKEVNTAKRYAPLRQVNPCPVV